MVVVALKTGTFFVTRQANCVSINIHMLTSENQDIHLSAVRLSLVDCLPQVTPPLKKNCLWENRPNFKESCQGFSFHRGKVSFTLHSH